MATVATLNAKVTANTASFTAAMQQAGKLAAATANIVDIEFGKIPSTLQKLQAQVTQLHQAFKDGKITASQLADGLNQVEAAAAKLAKQEAAVEAQQKKMGEAAKQAGANINKSFGIKPTKLEGFHNQVAKLEKDFKDGKISAKELQSGLQGVETAAAQAATSAMAIGAAIAVVAALAAAALAAAFAFVALVRSAANAAVEQYKVAQSIGVSTADLYALQQALRDTGANADDAADVFLSLQKTIASAGQGNLAAINTFKRLGVDVRELQNMKPPQQLAAIADIFSKIESAEERAALAVQLFGDKAKSILPALTAGSKALKDAADKSKSMGFGRSDNTIAQLQQVQIMWENLKKTAEGFGLKIASYVIPIVTALIDELPTVGEVLEWLGRRWDQFVDGFQKMLPVLNIIYRAFGAVFTAIGYVIGNLQGTFLDLFKTILTGINSVPGLPPEFKTGVENGIKAIETLGDINGAVTKKMGEGFMDFVNGTATPIDAVFDKINVKADAIGEKFKKLGGAKGSIKDVGINEAFFKRGLDIINEVASPIDKFNGKMMELDALLKAGAIDWDTYAKATAGAANELDRAHNLSSTSLSGAVKGGTVDAYSTITKAKQQDKVMNEKPAERMARLQKQGNDIAKQQLDVAKQTADAWKNMKIASIPGN